ncbi:cytochrome P450 [Nocardia takedensis]|uniref:cytochrome P450 n=1 Tax=Nocardia takedensis TaxID=259390 RepID=UPI0002F0BF73|nr:cytochrome P450 [Nocardia takedensis]
MLEVFDSGFAADPWPVLDRLRRQGGVHRVRTPDGRPAWLLTRYADVRAGLLDQRLSADTHRAGGRDYRAAPTALDALLTAAPEAQDRLRATVAAEAAACTAEWGRRLPDLLENLSADLDSADEVDLVRCLAEPLPDIVLADLLGLAEPEYRKLLDETTAAPGAVDALLAVDRAEAPLGGLLAGDRIGPAESAGLLCYLLSFWREVLADVVAGSVLTLLTRPDQIRVLRRGRNKPPMIDELVRYVSPQVLARPRYAAEDLTYGPYDIRAGDTVLLCLAAAHRDPAYFDSPGRVDLTRRRNRQLGFGHGAHACLGVALARTITAAVIEHLFTRWPATTLTVSPRDIEWRCGFQHRGPLTLPVRPA